jgi:hypothetical protein
MTWIAVAGEGELAPAQMKRVSQAGKRLLLVNAEEIGRASCRERVCRLCRSRWSPYH